MLKIFSNKKWESLIEIMIAVVILTIVLISVSKILWNSKITAQSSEKRMEAVSLAKEWLEIFRYYRKNNYMQYSDKKRICWNSLWDNWDWSVDYPYSWSDWKLDSNDSLCEESSTWTWSAKYILADGEIYIPSQNIADEDYPRFFLTTLWQDLTEIWNKKNDWKIFIDLKIFQLCKKINAPNKWLIMSCESMWLKDLPDSEKKRLPYFRALKIEYVNSLWELCSTNPDIDWDWNVDCNLADPKSLNQIKVTSSVIWPVWSWIQSVDLTTIFTDYEDRIDRDS